MVKRVRTLHIRDAVSKTFHIVGEVGEPGFNIDLHVDTSGEGLPVPEKYWDEVVLMYVLSKASYADEVLIEEEVNVSGSNEDIGDPAQRIWEEMIS